MSGLESAEQNENLVTELTLENVSPDLFDYWLDEYLKAGRLGRFHRGEVRGWQFARLCSLEGPECNALVYVVQLRTNQIGVRIVEPASGTIAAWVRYIWQAPSPDGIADKSPSPDGIADKSPSPTSPAATTWSFPIAPSLIPNPPVPSANGATWDDLFDWWYGGGKLEYITLRDVASVISSAYGTVKNKHSEYVKQHGKAPRKTE